MHFKLDANLDPSWGIPLQESGHQVSTAAEQGLSGAEDQLLATTCRDESLCLITADVDFAQILDYPPHGYNGLVVLRHPRPSLSGMLQLVLQVASPDGALWVVEPNRIRIHEGNRGN